MTFRASVGGETFRFPALRPLLARANEPKSGDELAGVAATSQRERVAAKIALADVRVGDVVGTELGRAAAHRLIESQNQPLDSSKRSGSRAVPQPAHAGRTV